LSAAAEQNGWLVLDEYIRFDSALSGRTMVGRKAFAVGRMRQQRPLPFDCLLIDDTSRDSRYTPDAIRECDEFAFYGVFVYFVSDRLDSRDGDNFRLVHMFKSYGDERYSKIWQEDSQGQEGRVLKGYTVGGSCYGYRNKYIRDQLRKGTTEITKSLELNRRLFPKKPR